MVDRFDVESGGYIGPSGGSGGMTLTPDGDYVRHSDYAALEAKLAKAREYLVYLSGMEGDRYDFMNTAHNALSALEA